MAVPLELRKTVVPVSLAGMQLADDVSDSLQFNRFGLDYSGSNLLLSWTNVGLAIPRPQTTVLTDIRDVLEEIKDLQVKAAHDSKWSRQDVLTAQFFVGNCAEST
jgi:hypothetical protein